MRHALGLLMAAGLAVRAQEIIETRSTFPPSLVGISLTTMANVALPHAVFLTEVPVVSNEGTVGTVIETVYDTMPTATEVQPYPTVTKVITETVTRHRHHHLPDFMASTKTVANIDGDGPVTLTSDMQLVGDHTLIKVMPQAPAATVVPLVSMPIPLATSIQLTLIFFQDLGAQLHHRLRNDNRHGLPHPQRDVPRHRLD